MLDVQACYRLGQATVRLVKELKCLKGLASGVHSYDSGVQPLREFLAVQVMAQTGLLTAFPIYQYSVVAYSFILLRPK
jgi:hypothetical protein